MPFIPHQTEFKNAPRAARLSAVGLFAARNTALVLLVLTVSVSSTTAQQQRFPIDMTPQDSETERGVYQPQRWQQQQQPAGALVQASFTQPEPSPTTPDTGAVNTPFISIGDDAVVSASSSGTGTAPLQDGVLLQLGTWTIIVLCLSVLTILGIRRWQRSRGMLPTGEQSGRVLDTLVLGPGRSVSLIQIQGLRAFVGCDASGIRTIAMASPSFDDAFNAEIDDPDAMATSTSDNLDSPLVTG